MDDDLVVGTVPLDSVEVLEPFGGVLLGLALVLLRRSSLKKGIFASPKRILPAHEEVAILSNANRYHRSRDVDWQAGGCQNDLILD